jgi:hypothetical protein
LFLAVTPQNRQKQRTLIAESANAKRRAEGKVVAAPDL